MKFRFEENSSKPEQEPKELFSDALVRWEKAPQLPREFDRIWWEEKYGINRENWIEQSKVFIETSEHDVPLLEKLADLDITQEADFLTLVTLLEKEEVQSTEAEKLKFFFNELILPRKDINLEGAEKEEWLTTDRDITHALVHTYGLPIKKFVVGLSEENFTLLIEKLSHADKSDFVHELANIRRNNPSTEYSLETENLLEANSELRKEYIDLLRTQGRFTFETHVGKNIPLRLIGFFTALSNLDPLDRAPAYAQMIDRITEHEETFARILSERIENNLRIHSYANPESSEPVADEVLRDFGGARFLETIFTLCMSERTQAAFDTFHAMKSHIVRTREPESPVDHYMMGANPYKELALPYEGAVEVITQVVQDLFPKESVPQEILKEIFTKRVDANLHQIQTAMTGNSRFLRLSINYPENDQSPTLRSGISLAHEAGHMEHAGVSHTLGKNIMFNSDPYITESIAGLSEILFLEHIQKTFTFENKEEEISLLCEELNRLYGLFFKNIELLEFEHQLYEKASTEKLTLEYIKEASLLHAKETYGKFYTIPEGAQYDWVFNAAQFYVSPYYRTSYILAYMTALHFQERFLNDTQGTFHTDYLNYMKESTLDNPQEIFLKYGIDFTANIEELFSTTLATFERKLARFQELLEE